MLAALSTIAPLAKMLFSTVDKAIPDKDLAEKLKAQLNTQLLQSSTEEIKAAASIVEAEAKSHWFVSSWRPLLMYVLIFILVWNYVRRSMLKGDWGAMLGSFAICRRIFSFASFSAKSCCFSLQPRRAAAMRMRAEMIRERIMA